MSAPPLPRPRTKTAAEALAGMRPIEYTTLSGRVYADLRELLISGQLQPGEKLTLRALSEALGTSAMPIREAVRQLGAEKALEILPNRSLRVPVMSAARFRELLLVRCALEGLAVEQAVEHIDDDELAQAQAAGDAFAQEMERAKPNIGRVIQHNKELHFTVYRAARLPGLLEMIETLWLQVGPVLNLDLRAGSARVSGAPAVEHHSGLLRALHKRDAAAAREALLGDLRSAARVILDSGRLAE
jgi:DNA-binding GntR family transcriptional regulator